MRIISASIIAVGMVWTLASGALATEFTKGEIIKIDVKQKKLTIAHEELKALDMPAMKMVFVVADDSMLENVTEGQQIEFIVEKVNGRLTVTEIKE